MSAAIRSICTAMAFSAILARMPEYISGNMGITPLTQAQLITEGSSKLASVPSGGGGGGAAAPTASGGAAPAAAAVEEKEEEKEVRARDALIPITTFSRSRILTSLPNYRSPTRIWASVSSTKRMFFTNESKSKKKKKKKGIFGDLGECLVCALRKCYEICHYFQIGVESTRPRRRLIGLELESRKSVIFSEFGTTIIAPRVIVHDQRQLTT